MTLAARCVPSLLARDLGETLHFYEVLGFRLSGGGADEGWMEIKRDGAVLQFYRDPPIGMPTAPVISGTLYFYPKSVKALADEWRGRVAFEWEPEVMDYGMFEFGLRDPNGYVLAFTEEAAT